MDIETAETTLQRSFKMGKAKRSKSPFKLKAIPQEDSLGSSERSKGKSGKNKGQPLAAEDSLGNSETDRSISIREDEDNWFDNSKIGLDDLSKRTQTMHSIASTATLTSNESSHGNTSFSNSTWSPSSERRGISYHKSPLRSPKYKNLVSDSSDTNPIAALPLTPSKSQNAESERGRTKSNRRLSDVPPNEEMCDEIKETYFQPSKASLHDANQNKPSKKPQRVRRGTRSKSPNDPSIVRSRSNERNAKTKASPSLSRRRKSSSLKNTVPLDENTNASFHESWPQPNKKEKKVSKDVEKGKRKKQSKNKKGKTDDINEVITFFEGMAVHKEEIKRSAPSRGLGKKSNSARFTKRSKSPASSSAASSSAHGRMVDGEVLESSDKRRERRSSAPAKALAAFNQYRQTVGGPDFEKLDDEPPEPPPPREKILLDVSELAALEIIRLGTDNSLKLDLFDLMNHLKRQQERQNC